MSGIDPNAGGALVVPGGGTSLPTASAAGELPVSDGAGSAYTATARATVVQAALSDDAPAARTALALSPVGPVPLPVTAFCRWPLDELTGTYANSGTQTTTLADGATAPTVRRIGSGARFGVRVHPSGSTPIFGASASIPSGSAITLLTWVELSSVPGGIACVLQKRWAGGGPPYASLGLYLGASALRWLAATVGTAPTPQSANWATSRLILNRPQLYALTYDGTTMRGYIDGQPVGTSTPTGGAIDWTAGNGSATDRYWQVGGNQYIEDLPGVVADAVVIESVLTQPQIEAIYQRGAGHLGVSL